MPKQWWYHWGPKSSNRNSSAAKPPQAAGGCMGAVFELFHSHQLHLRLHHHRSFDPEDHHGQGMQAPRYSFEAEEVVVGTTASLSEHANSSSKGVQISASRRDTELLKAGDGQSNGQAASSGSSTPSLVARLMGLGPLPEGFPTSPRPSKDETPKSSLSLDVDGFNRGLSLQVSCGKKEGSSKLARHSCSEVNAEKWESSWKVGEEENSMPTMTFNPYAARVRKKFGADITNKKGELQGREQRRDEILLSCKTKNSTIRHGSKKCHPSGPGGILSGSWRAKGQGQAPGSDKEPVRQKRSCRCPIAAPQAQEPKQKQNPVSQNYHDGAKEGNAGSRFKSLNKKEEQFVHVKTMPFSSKLRRGNLVVHSLVPLQKIGKEEVVVQKKAAHKPTKPNTPKAFKPGSTQPPEHPAATAELGFQLIKGFYDSGLGPDTDFVAWVPESDDIVGEIEKEMVDKLVLDTLVALGCYD